ncbi:hypothetical protein ACEWY4_019734 [Coilia grayii]|uniref:Protein kinase domain-containing protein n=1 Tax=Coilia grayii TaxID=363190 RepID=A0ABD1JDS1_9TELE
MMAVSRKEHQILIVHEYIHGANLHQILHRKCPIKISERTKTAYLTDWGLANMRDSLAQFGAAAPGDFCGPQGAGTDLYMAPEIFLHNSHCTTMSDMWSLGLTYLEMFTSCEPWTLNNRSALNGLLSKQEPPHALAKLQPHLTDIVKPLVEYKPESRMNSKDLVACLKSKVDLVKRYGYTW